MSLPSETSDFHLKILKLYSEIQIKNHDIFLSHKTINGEYTAYIMMFPLKKLHKHIEIHHTFERILYFNDIFAAKL